MNKQSISFLRKPDVLALTNFSKSTLHNRIDQGLICPPVSIGGRSVAFIETEVQAVLSAMAAERTPEQIKELVEYLIDNRFRYAESLEV